MSLCASVIVRADISFLLLHNKYHKLGGWNRRLPLMSQFCWSEVSVGSAGSSAEGLGVQGQCRGAASTELSIGGPGKTLLSGSFTLLAESSSPKQWDQGPRFFVLSGGNHSELLRSTRVPCHMSAPAIVKLVTAGQILLGL